MLIDIVEKRGIIYLTIGSLDLSEKDLLQGVKYYDRFIIELDQNTNIDLNTMNYYDPFYNIHYDILNHKLLKLKGLIQKVKGEYRESALSFLEIVENGIYID